MTDAYEAMVTALARLPAHQHFLQQCAKGLQEYKKRQMAHPYSPAGRLQIWLRSAAV